MSGEKTLVDTNLLVYAFQPGEGRHQKAFVLLDEIMGRKEGVVSAQNLAEFCSLATEKFRYSMSFEQAKRVLLELSEGMEVISYSEHTVAEALNLCTIHEIHFFDALLVATMQEHGINKIATENEKDFKKIPWLKVVNPFKAR